MQGDESSTSWCEGLRQELFRFFAVVPSVRPFLLMLIAAASYSILYFDRAKGAFIGIEVFLMGLLLEVCMLTVAIQELVQEVAQEPNENEHVVINVHDDSEGNYGTLVGDNID